MDNTQMMNSSSANCTRNTSTNAHSHSRRLHDQQDTHLHWWITAHLHIWLNVSGCALGFSSTGSKPTARWARPARQIQPRRHQVKLQCACRNLYTRGRFCSIEHVCCPSNLCKQLHLLLLLLQPRFLAIGRRKWGSERWVLYSCQVWGEQRRRWWLLWGHRKLQQRMLLQRICIIN